MPDPAPDAPPKSTKEIAQNIELSDDAKPLISDSIAPHKFYEELVAKGLLLDAVKFLAHALPKRQAVWWACQCARAAGVPAKPEIDGALAAAEAWVRDPSEEHRRAAQAASDTATLAQPAGCAALAAFFSGGSLGPANTPVVPPADHLTGHAAGGAVQMAAVIVQPEQADEKLKRFLTLGRDIAAGRSLWN